MSVDASVVDTIERTPKPARPLEALPIVPSSDPDEAEAHIQRTTQIYLYPMTLQDAADIARAEKTAAEEGHPEFRKPTEWEQRPNRIFTSREEQEDYVRRRSQVLDHLRLERVRYRLLEKDLQAAERQHRERCLPGQSLGNYFNEIAEIDERIRLIEAERLEDVEDLIRADIERLENTVASSRTLLDKVLPGDDRYAGLTDEIEKLEAIEQPDESTRRRLAYLKTLKSDTARSQVISALEEDAIRIGQLKKILT